MRRSLFSDRLDAAKQLIPLLQQHVNNETVVIAIPRGAVPMGYLIAKTLHVPFDILLVKKIGYPGNPELAVGSVSVNGAVIDPEFAVRKEYIDQETKRLQKMLQEREAVWRVGQPPLSLRHKTVILIDDGMATGNSMLAAVNTVKRQEPAKIIAAVPVASESALNRIKTKADAFICLHIPQEFMAVGDFYEDFQEISDAQVGKYLHHAMDLKWIQPL